VEESISKEQLPRFILFAVIVLVVILIGVGLWRAGHKETAKTGPSLTISAPAEGASVSVDKVTVKGKTTDDAKVKVNNQSVKLSKDGSFQSQASLSSGENFIFVKASAKGRDTVVQRRVVKVAAVPALSNQTASQPVTAGPSAVTKSQQLSQSGPADTALTLFGFTLVGLLAYVWRRQSKVS
jgi:hypothetical protein